MKSRYTYRLRPGASAERALWEEEGRNRWVWNEACAARKGGLPKFDDKALTAARREHDWLAAGVAGVQQQTLRDFHTAKHQNRNFRVKGRSLPTLNFTRQLFALRPDGESGAVRLVVARGIVLPVVWSRDLPSPPSSVRVFLDRVGHWWASFVVDVGHEALPESGAAIGIDWGVAAIATTTDSSYDLPHLHFGRKQAAKLAAAQRRIARRKPQPGQHGSKGYRQAKHQAAVAHQRVRDSRRDLAHKWAARVVANHGLIAVEDFRPRFLSQTRMAYAAADGAIGAIKATLIEFAKRDGRQVVIVPPAYTTMDCSVCGARAKTRLSLSQRTYCCSSCGATLGRDLNAARNTLARALEQRPGFKPVGDDGSKSSSGAVRTAPGTAA